MSARHSLKTWPGPFAAVASGQKTHEIREDDRPFAVGDTLHLQEYQPVGASYSGRTVDVEVTCITRGGEWGIPPGLCVMSIRRAAVVATATPPAPKLTKAQSEMLRWLAPQIAAVIPGTKGTTARILRDLGLIRFVAAGDNRQAITPAGCDALAAFYAEQGKKS